jgi:hypothetical protein
VPGGLEAHHPGGLRREQLADLFGHGRDDLAMLALTRDKGRDAPERRLLSEQAAQLRLRLLRVSDV